MNKVENRLAIKRPRQGTTRLVRIVSIVFMVSISLAIAEGIGRIALRVAAGRWQPLPSPFFNRIPVLRPSENLGWEYIPNGSGVQIKDGQVIEWHINSKGLRETEEHSYERGKNSAQRILVLGDSFTAGDGVEEKDRWTEIVGRNLGPHAQIINSGVPAYAQDQELLWYRSEGVHYDVDVVVLAYLEENLVRIGVPYFPYEPRYKKTSFQIRNGSLAAIKSDAVTRARIELSYRLLTWYSLERLIFYPTIGSVAYRSYNQTDHRDLVPLLIAIFDEMRRIAETRGNTFAVLSLPDTHLEDLEARFELDDFICSQASKRSITYHSTLRQLLSEATTNSLRRDAFSDGHWTALGNERFADAVLPFFETLVAVDTATDREVSHAASEPVL